MDLQHVIGEFKNHDNKLVVSKFYDDDEIRAYSDTNPVPAELFKTLRWPEYHDKLTHANIVLVKKKLAESVSPDIHIIQAINAIEELDKVCNTLVKRIREWYGYYYPELEHAVGDNELFIKKILQKTKEEFMNERKETVSMGPDISEVDLNTIITFARQVDDMYLQREKLILYIDNTLMSYCPNMYSITGGLIGAKLIEKARSLKHLAMMPSSTIQLLGAEKALFRHLRNKNIRPPKHGLILSHLFVMTAKRSNKGTAARRLAAKIAIAAKIDYFKGEFIGDQLKEELDTRSKE